MSGADFFSRTDVNGGAQRGRELAWQVRVHGHDGDRVPRTHPREPHPPNSKPHKPQTQFLNLKSDLVLATYVEGVDGSVGLWSREMKRAVKRGRGRVWQGVGVAARQR
eukprot:1615555-Rhodomonas_salina.2